MKLYIGGEGSGHLKLAQLENPGSEIIDNFQDKTAKALKAGLSAQDLAKQLVLDKPDAVVICTEIGMGIHPLDPFERKWREETGRALCILASYAESVTRVVCGIGQRIK